MLLLKLFNERWDKGGVYIYFLFLLDGGLNETDGLELCIVVCLSDFLLWLAETKFNPTLSTSNDPMAISNGFIDILEELWLLTEPSGVASSWIALN